MQDRRFATLSALCLLFSAPPCALAGDFSKGFGRTDTVKFAIPKLPPIYTGAKRIAVILEDSPAGFPSQQLSAAIEMRLAQDFVSAPSNPEITFRIRTFFEQPKSEVTSRTENVRVQTGTRTAVDANGNPIRNAAGQQVQEPVYENQQLPVEAWQGTGRLSLQVEVFGADGRVIDGFSPSQSYSKRAVVTANGVPQIDRNQLPSEPQITDAMIQAVAEPFFTRYCRQKEIIEVRLAVDEELRQGNELAKAGQWPKAVELWQAVDPKKFPGDRQHNLGVAYEATFYELYWRGEAPLPLDRMESTLREARKHHDAAILRDPKEKNHAVAQDRLRVAAALLSKLQQIQSSSAASGSAVSAALSAASSSSSGGGTQTAQTAPPAPPPAESAVAQEFRRLVRMRIRNLAVTPDNERASLESTGVQAFQLSADEAKRLMELEIQPWLKVRENLLTYKSTFDAFNQDQKIGREERQVLRGLAARLSLLPDDLKLVEVPGTFTDTP